MTTPEDGASVKKKETSLRRLVLVKHLYLDGVDRAGFHSNYVDQLLATINLFLAVETLMRAVVLEVDEQPDEVVGSRGYTSGPPSIEQVRDFKVDGYHSFEQLYDQVVAILRYDGKLQKDVRLFDWQALRRLQKARNDAQHGATAPNSADMPHLVTVVKDFVECILGHRFPSYGTTIAEISMTALLDDVVLRSFAETAEVALGRGHRRLSALSARIAFLLGRLKRRYDWWRDQGEGRERDVYDDWAQMAQDWHETGLWETATEDPIGRLLFRIMLHVSDFVPLYDNWVLGLDYRDRSRFDNITPRLAESSGFTGLPSSDEVLIVPVLEQIISGSGNWKGPYFPHEPSKDGCLWVCDYVTDSLLRWQHEERRQNTKVPTRYLDALPTLETHCP